LTHASLPVSGMTCADCEEAIQHSVAKLSGVSMVKANHLQGRVEVDYDPRQVNEQQIIAAIERLQYKVENPQAAEGDQAAEDAADLSADDQGGDDSADGCGCCGGSKGDQGQQA
jgi:copper chaperone CopZ